MSKSELQQAGDAYVGRLQSREPQDIEVTPKMVQAGLDALLEYPITEGGEPVWKEAVVAVYKAMIRAKG